MSHPEKVERVLLREGLFPLICVKVQKKPVSRGLRPAKRLALDTLRLFLCYALYERGKSTLYIVRMFAFFPACCVLQDERLTSCEVIVLSLLIDRDTGTGEVSVSVKALAISSGIGERKVRDSAFF